MRIAFLVPRFPVLSETFILNQIVGLIDRGHDVDIYAERPGNTAKIHPDVEKYQLLSKTFYPQIPQNQVLRLFKGMKLSFVNFGKYPTTLLGSWNIFKYGKLAASLNLFYMAMMFLGKQPYDILHCQFGMNGLQGMILRRIGVHKGKLLTSFRGMDLTVYVQQSGAHIYQELFAEGDLFLPVSDSMKHQLIKLGCDPKKVIVHRSGIDCQKFPFIADKSGYDEQPVKIVTVARLVEKKGVEYGIRAVAKVVTDKPNLEYNIIGDGPLNEYLEQLIHKLNVADKVKLLGWKQQQEVVEILKNTNILLAPSVTGKDGNQEGIPNALKEAMAIGLPIVSTQHSGIPELVENGVTGFLVPERDVDTLAEKLGYLINHPEIWQTMGKAGRTHVEEHYDINNLNDQLVKIYQQVLANGKTS